MTAEEFIVETMARFSREFGRDTHLLIALGKGHDVVTGGCCATGVECIIDSLRTGKADRREDITEQVNKAANAKDNRD